MNRWLAVVLLVLTACATHQSPPVVAAVPAPAPGQIDPTVDPTIIGAVDEAAREGSIASVQGAQIGRRVGRVLGVFAAVFGGPPVESLDDTIDRYRRTRDAATATGAMIAGSRAAAAGAKRGFDFDAEFAELHDLKLDVLRPYTDQIDLRFDAIPPADVIEQVSAVLSRHEARAIDVEASLDSGQRVIEALKSAGATSAAFSLQRDDSMPGIVLHLRYAR